MENVSAENNVNASDIKLETLKLGKEDLTPYKELKKTEPNTFNQPVTNLEVILKEKKLENKKLELKDNPFRIFEGSSSELESHNHRLDTSARGPGRAIVLMSARKWFNMGRRICLTHHYNACGKQQYNYI